MGIIQACRALDVPRSWYYRQREDRQPCAPPAGPERSSPKHALSPGYPEQFESLEHARVWARAFFEWYNNNHHHVGLGLMTPAVVHYGQDDVVRTRRQQVLDAAYARHPERFVQGPPVAAGPPSAVWINPPQDTTCSGPVAAEAAPGAQPGSSANALEAGEHLATIEPTLWPFWEEKSSLILIGELSQSL